MYRGYNLKLDALPTFLSQFKMEGENYYNSLNASVIKAVNKLKSDDGTIDGSKLQANWFPIVSADVFISHSNEDTETAKLLAGWLKNSLNLNPFIDSCVWGNAYDLLKQIDNTYCLMKEANLYDYDSRNRSTCHVYMMLTNALANMINNTDCVLFLNTPKSIRLDGKNVTQTLSPWIYTEIALSNMVEERKKGVMKSKALMEDKLAASLSITHDVDLSKYAKLTSQDLSYWGQSGKKGNEALEYLYANYKTTKGY